MRKLYIYMVLLAGIVSSCTKPDIQSGASTKPQEETYYDQGFSQMDESQADASSGSLLVSGVALPRAFAPVLHSDGIRVKMTGFKNGDDLCLVSEDGAEHKAEIVEADASGIAFRLPPAVVSGDYALRIVRGTASQDLGIRYIMCDTPSTTAGVNIKGTAYLDGKPAFRIVISDGYEFTVTDEEGKYNLVSEKANGYVFAQTPANAVARVDRAIPQFFVHVSHDTGAVETADFRFDSCDNSKHRVIVVTDLHLSDNMMDADWSCTEYFMPDLNATIDRTDVPCYIFTAGDQTTESRWAYGDLYDWREYISGWKCPIYHCMGNHDNNPKYVAADFESESTYKQVIGPNWYSLDIGGVHYVVLDDIVYDNSPATSSRGYYVRVARHQLDYLKKDLAKVDPSTPVVVFSHSPFFLTRGVEQVTPRFESYEDIYDLVNCLDGFHEVHFLAGHTHVNHNMVVRPGFMEHNIAASSGSTWLCEYHTGTRTHLGRDGVIGGYQIWDASGRELSWVHKSLGRPVEQGQFHVVDLNLVPEVWRETTVENAVLINVYNWDEAWEVNVSEEGKTLKAVQVYRDDPVYMLAFPEKISSQTTPAATDHLFMVQASSPTSTLEIEITDRFGNIYRKEMTRPYDYVLKNYE